MYFNKMQIPIIDINNSHTIIDACQKFGFFYVPYNDFLKNTEQIEIINYIKDYFKKTPKDKFKDKIDESLSGYIYSNSEIELKEKFRYWPGCRFNIKILDSYYKKINQLACIIFEKICESLNIKDYSHLINNNYNVLEVIHYSMSNNDNVFGIREHSDWGLITILFTTEEGLQIKNLQNQWINVPIIDNHFIVNIGDMLELLSNGVYRSTRHQVKIIKEKYSLAYFFEPSINSCINGVVYGDYLNEKLEQFYKY